MTKLFFLYCIFLCILCPGHCNLTEYQQAYQASLTLEKNCEYPKALETLQSIYEKYQEDYDLNFRLGYLSYLNARYESAYQYWQKAVQLHPGSIESQNWILLTLIMMQRWTQAEEYAKNIIKQYPTNYYANIRLAYVYYLQEKWDNALARYQIIYTFYPSDLDIRLGLASTYLALGKKDKAKYFYLEILKVSPFHTAAYQGYCLTIE
ncbi:MAG: tetratricopeptide repeat protein [Candidatus Brocadiae bacterium]|nr:tetratricopeptide repeat protein [Candidatus Brocadiia bacterium]